MNSTIFIPIRRFIAGLTILALALPSSAFAVPIASMEMPAGAPTAITLIMDAHASLEAQKSIVQQLETLEAQGTLQGLLIEGAAGELDAQKLLVFKKAESNQAYGNELMARGLIGGGLRFFMNHPDLKAYGLEDPNLYAENRKQYQKVMRAKAYLDPLLVNLEKTLEAQAEQAFSAQAKTLFKISRMSADHGAMDFEVLRDVMQAAMTSTDLDWNDWRQQTAWPNLMRLWRLWDENNSTLPNEQQARIEKLDGKTAREKLENLYSADLLPNEVKTQVVADAKKLEEVEPLLQHLALQALREEIKTPELFQEVSRLETVLSEHGRISEQEKNLLQRLKQVALIRKTLSLALSRQEAASLSGLLLGTQLESFQKDLSAAQYRGLLHGLSAANLFYEWARFRETTLRDQIKKHSLARDGKGAWAVVVGGFHQEGLVELLRQSGLQTNVVMPEFDGQNDPLLYHRLMNSAEKGTLALPQIAGYAEYSASCKDGWCPGHEPVAGGFRLCSSGSDG